MTSSLSGVQYYDDLQKPVTKAEAVVISDIVEKAVRAVLPGAEIRLMGGFRRSGITLTLSLQSVFEHLPEYTVCIQKV